jgi:hypothetical protein
VHALTPVQIKSAPDPELPIACGLPFGPKVILHLRRLRLPRHRIELRHARIERLALRLLEAAEESAACTGGA